MWHQLSLNHDQVPSVYLQTILHTCVFCILFKSICAFGIKTILTCACTLEFSTYLSTRKTLSHGWPENFKVYEAHLKLQNREDIFLTPSNVKLIYLTHDSRKSICIKIYGYITSNVTTILLYVFLPLIKELQVSIISLNI